MAEQRKNFAEHNTQWTVSAKAIEPLHAGVIVSDMNFGERITSSGLIIMGDDKQELGIHPRWGKVDRIGKDQKDVKPGQWILVKHGRWSRGIDFTDSETGEHKILRAVDPNDILLIWDGEGIPPEVSTTEITK